MVDLQFVWHFNGANPKLLKGSKKRKLKNPSVSRELDVRRVYVVNWSQVDLGKWLQQWEEEGDSELYFLSRFPGTPFVTMLSLEQSASVRSSSCNGS